MAIADEVFLFRKLGPAILRDCVGPGGERAHEDLPPNSGGGSSPLHGQCAFYVGIHCARPEIVRGVYHNIDISERGAVDWATQLPRHRVESLAAGTAGTRNDAAPLGEPRSEMVGDEAI